MRIHLGILLLAASCIGTGCNPPSIGGDGAQADAITNSQGKPPMEHAGAVYGVIVGLDRQPVPDGVAADIAIGAFNQSIVTDASGSYLIHPASPGQGTITVYYGVLPELGPDPIELSTRIFAFPDASRFSVGLAFDGDGRLVLSQF